MLENGARVNIRVERKKSCFADMVCCATQRHDCCDSMLTSRLGSLRSSTSAAHFRRSSTGRSVTH